MQRKILAALCFFLGVLTIPLSAAAAGYGQRLCQSNADVKCIRIGPEDSWESLWPDDRERDLVQRLNRRNTEIFPGMVIAVPNNMNLNPNDLSPFKSNVGYLGHDQVVVNPNQLAWAAYDKEGNLVKWGPAAAGQSSCEDEGGRNCRTPVGEFTVYDKKGESCVSSEFPIPKGGAKMPYCMHFKGGYALHGSYEVLGANLSHGCVRMFPQDAAWLNHNFVKIGSTRVIIESYYTSS